MPSVLVIFKSASQRSYFDGVSGYHLLFHHFSYDVAPVAQAEAIIRKLRQSKKTISGVIAVADDPSILAAIVAEKLGLPGPDPRSIYRAQNKAVLIRFAKAVSTNYPPTQIIPHARSRVSFQNYPAFLKPAKGSLSKDAHMISSKEELRNILPKLFEKGRAHVTWTDSFFRSFGNKSDPPSSSFLLQRFIDAQQYTVDGYVYHKKVMLVGVTTSVYTPDRKSFERFDFPAQLSSSVVKRVSRLVHRLVAALGFDNSAFNMEFFVVAGKPILIEFNTRVSVQFVPLLSQHYRRNYLEVLCDLAVGKRPVMAFAGNGILASSCVLRRSGDCYIEKIPLPEEIAQVQSAGHASAVRVLVEEGKRLSDYEQDSYTFRYAIVDIVGKNKKDIAQKLAHAKRCLTFQFRNA